MARLPPAPTRAVEPPTPGLDPVVKVVAAAWALEVLAALALSGASASAGILPEPLVTVTMLGSFVLVAVVGWAATRLPETWPTLFRRLVLLVGMAGTLWATGTLVRAAYALG